MQFGPDVTLTSTLDLRMFCDLVIGLGFLQFNL